jgi:hypothetical protein
MLQHALAAVIVVISSAYRREDPWFESHLGIKFFRNLYIAVQQYPLSLRVIVKNK